MRMRLGAEPKITPPRLVIAYVCTLRGKPRGSHLMAGSFDAPGSAFALFPRLVAMLYALRCLRIASPAGVIGGTGSGLLLVPGPTHAPDRSRFGAGPGGFGIFGIPSEMKPSFTAGAPPWRACPRWAETTDEHASAATTAMTDAATRFRISAPLYV